MLVQNDDFGAAYEEGFRKAIKGTNIKVVKVEKYPPGANEVGAQMTSLAATKADAFFDGATLLACPDALKKAQAANWKPITGCRAPASPRRSWASPGDAARASSARTNSWTRVNPAVRQRPGDEALQVRRSRSTSRRPTPTTASSTIGWTEGALLVKALEASKRADRLDVMNAVRHLSAVTGGAVPRRVSRSPRTATRTRTWPRPSQVAQYDSTKKYFHEVGGLDELRGQDGAS